MTDTLDTTPSAAEKVARDFFATFSTGDVDAILALLHDDVTWVVSGKLEGMSGPYDKAAFGQLIGGVADVYKAPLTITPTAVHVADKWVTVETDSYAELKDGRVYNPSGVFVVEVAPDGLLKTVKEFFDTKHAHDIFFAS